MDECIRVQKYIADNGICSRRAAEKLIEQGRVTINERKAVPGDKINPRHAVVKIDGKAVKRRDAQKVYIMMYKPRGYVTTVKDELGRKSVMDIVSREKTRVYPVGRLDIDSEGLLIMTNDGELTNKLTHPRHHVPKTYRTIITGTVDRVQLQALANGVYIADGDYKTGPAEVSIKEIKEDRSILYITICEGKNRQIRKMCEAVGINVLRLKREKLGKLSIGTLRAGKYRYLTSNEIDYLKSL